MSLISQITNHLLKIQDWNYLRPERNQNKQNILLIKLALVVNTCYYYHLDQWDLTIFHSRFIYILFCIILHITNLILSACKYLFLDLNEKISILERERFKKKRKKNEYIIMVIDHQKNNIYLYNIYIYIFKIYIQGKNGKHFKTWIILSFSASSSPFQYNHIIV